MIRGGAIGDFVLTLPALRLIRETLPDAHVEVLRAPGGKLEDLDADEVVELVESRGLL